MKYIKRLIKLLYSVVGFVMFATIMAPSCSGSAHTYRQANIVLCIVAVVFALCFVFRELFAAHMQWLNKE